MPFPPRAEGRRKRKRIRSFGPGPPHPTGLASGKASICVLLSLLSQQLSYRPTVLCVCSSGCQVHTSYPALRGIPSTRNIWQHPKITRLDAEKLSPYITLLLCGEKRYFWLRSLFHLSQVKGSSFSPLLNFPLRQILSHFKISSFI